MFLHKPCMCRPQEDSPLHSHTLARASFPKESSLWGWHAQPSHTQEWLNHQEA